MRRTFIVAAREYAENAKTKGFWIGLFLLPVMLTVGIEVPRLLESRGTPTRSFVLVDQSGGFEKVVAAALERQRQKQILEALNAYSARHIRAEKMKASREAAGDASDLEKIPGKAINTKKFLDDFAESNPQALEAFVKQGGEAFFLEQIRPMLDPDAPTFEPPEPRYRRAELPKDISPESPIREIALALKPYLIGEKKIASASGDESLFAAILIPPDTEKFTLGAGEVTLRSAQEGSDIEYWSANVTDDALYSEIERAINDELRRRAFVSEGVSPTVVRKIQSTRASIASLNPKKEEGKEEVSLADILRQWIPVAFVYLLWISIFMVAQMLLNNMIEEKSNRVVEVLLSSVTPNQLMMGKLIGIAGIGLTMIAAWIMSFIGIIFWKTGTEAEWARELFTVLKTSNLLPYFVVYFLLGYLFYAGLFLSLGSVCNTLKEAQNFMMPVTLILMVPLLTMAFIPKDPNGTLARILSWIPFYSPFVMMNRAAADPPAVDRIGTFFLMFITTGLMLWFSGRVFRAGILRTGQPPKLVEIIRWVVGRV